MSTYRYNVIVDVTMNTSKVGAGKSSVEGMFKSMEAEAARTSASIDRAFNNSLLQRQAAEIKHTQFLASEAAKRRQMAIDDYNRQRQDYIRNIQRQADEIRRIEQTEAQRNASVAATRRSGAISGYFQQMGISNDPTAINRQTAANAATQQRLRTFADSEISTAMGNIDRVLNGQKVRDTDRALKSLNETTAQGTKQMGMWGAAFKGAFIGAVAGMVFSSIISGITGVVGAMKDGIVQAVHLAAEFQTTTNALSVFTGSTSSARAELSSLAKVARETPGLRLEDAQVGATRLRALSFEAKTAENLIVGLAKQRLISGVTDEQAMNRVIVNLQQLRAGSPQIQRDIQQMVLAIPSLSKEIDRAFGSIDKFKAALRRDPNAAIEKFAESLKNAQAPAPGLTDAIGKLEDAVISAGRAFGEPLLEPLTISVQNLSKFVYDNMTLWTQWGQSVADAVSGVTNAIQGIASLTGQTNSSITDYTFLGNGALSKLERNTMAFGAGGPLGFLGYKGYQALGEYGKYKRDQETDRRTAEKIAGESDLLKRLGYSQDFVGPISEDMIGERDAQRRNAAKKAQEEAERLRQQDLVYYKRYNKEALALSQDRFAKESALLNSYIRRSAKDELDFTRQSASLKKRQIAEEITIQTSFYEQMLARTEKGTDEEKDLISERNITLSRLNAQMVTSSYESQKAIAEAEEKVREERRQNFVEFTAQMGRQITQFNDLQISYFEQWATAYETGYSDTFDAISAGYQEQVRQAQLATTLELEQEKLTAEERINIRMKLYGDLEGLAQDNAKRMIEIQERAFAESANRLRSAQQVSSGLAGITGGGYRSVMGQMQPNGLFGQTLPRVGLINMFGRGGMDINDAVSQVYQGRSDFYGALSVVQDKAHRLEEVGLQREIDLNEDLIELERQRTLGVERLNLAQQQALQTRLNQMRDEASRRGDEPSAGSYDAQMQSNFNRMQQTEALIAKIEAKDPTVNSIESRRLKNENVILKLKQDQLTVEQHIEDQQLRQATELATINELTQKILKGDQDNVLTQVNRLNAAQNLQKSALEYQAASVALTDQQTISMMQQAEVMNTITQLRKEEMDAMNDIARSQVLIENQLRFSQNKSDATVLRFLAQQKGITEIISDTKINLLTSAYSAMDSVIGRLTQKMGLFGDAVKELLSGLVKLAFNSVFQKLFGLGGGSSGGGRSGGGFSLFGGGGGGNGLFGSLGNGLFGGGSRAGSSGGGLTANVFSTPGVSNSLITPGGGLFSVGGGGGLLGAGEELLGVGGSAGGAAGAGGLLSTLGGGLLAGLPLIGGGLGAMVGGSSVGGQILGGVGGILAGVAGLGGFLTAFAGTGVAAGAAGALGASLTAGILAAAPFAAVAAPLLIAGAYFVGRSQRRRRDEKIRDKAMVDALASLDKLISDVNSDRIDGSAALEQANGIRAQYVEQMSQLKTKKTRGIALKDVSRLDAKIAALNSAVMDQNNRRERLELMVPTFASGGSLRRNPLGYQSGKNIMGYFPEADEVAMFNEKGSEYILDAATTRNIGVNNLDLMRATKGASFHELRKKIARKSMASGGSMVNTGSSTISTGGDSGGPMTLELNLNIGLSQENFVQIIEAAVKGNNGSREQLTAIVNQLKLNGEQNPLSALLADQIKKLG